MVLFIRMVSLLALLPGLWQFDPPYYLVIDVRGEAHIKGEKHSLSFGDTLSLQDTLEFNTREAFITCVFPGNPPITFKNSQASSDPLKALISKALEKSGFQEKYAQTSSRGLLNSQQAIALALTATDPSDAPNPLLLIQEHRYSLDPNHFPMDKAQYFLLRAGGHTLPLPYEDNQLILPYKPIKKMMKATEAEIIGLYYLNNQKTEEYICDIRPVLVSQKDLIKKVKLLRQLTPAPSKQEFMDTYLIPYLTRHYGQVNEGEVKWLLTQVL